MDTLSLFTSANIAIGLAAAVVAIVLYIGFLALRNPVLVKLGLRNIPRRPTQSVLIIVGLTLSTVIIVSALSLGDTLNYSIRLQAVSAYGPVDEIIAPPLLSQFATLASSDPDAATDTAEQETAATETQDQLSRLTEGGLTSVLAVLEGGLPGISQARYEQLRTEAAQEPLIDGVAGSIIFPTIIRNVTTGQGEPLGFIFAVDDDYDTQFGLTNIQGQPVEMEQLKPGVGNIFGQAAGLFDMVGAWGQGIGLGDIQISDVALATAAVGAVLTGATGDTAIDLATLSLPVTTLKELGLDTTELENAGIYSLTLESLGITTATLQSFGVTTTTVDLSTLDLASLGIDAGQVPSITNQLLSSFNLNTMGREVDRVLAQVGLQLRQGDVYLNRLGADKLGAQVGDELEIFIGPIPVPFRVKAIVDQSGPLGALTPVVMLRLDEAQQLLFMRGKVNNVLISNLGDDMTGVEHTEAVSTLLRALALDEDALVRIATVLRTPAVRQIIDAKAPRVMDEMAAELDDAGPLAGIIESFAQIQDYLDAVRSLPAALDEPGTAALRATLANGTVREWLLGLDLPAAATSELQVAFAELNQFDLLDPLNKATILTVSDVAGAAFTSIFSVFGAFTILAGVLLIFLIFVMLAAERRSELGMARAIGMQRGHLVQMFVTEGLVYDLISAVFGVALGLAIAYGMIGFIGALFDGITGQFSQYGGVFRLEFRTAPASIVIAYCLGVLFTFLVVTVAATRVSRLNIVTAIRDLPDSEIRSRRSWLSRLSRLVFGPLLAGAGALLILYGSDGRLSVLLTGTSLVVVGLSFLAGWLLIRTALRTEQVQRLVYTVIGLGLLLIWGVPWPTVVGEGSLMEVFSEGPWVLLSFVLTGPLLILGAILVIMFNADAWTWGINQLLGGFGALTPVLKTAIAYPLSTRFRTGMSMLLFAMVIATVTIMAVVIEATQTIVAPDQERTAGFDIEIDSSLLSFFDPITDLSARIATNPEAPAADIAGVATVAAQGNEVRVQGEAAWRRATVVGVSTGYWEQAATVYTFGQRAPGFESDEAVWEALRTQENVAVVTQQVVSRPFGPGQRGGPPAGDPEDPDDEDFVRRLQLAEFVGDTGTLPELYLEFPAPVEGGAIPAPVQIIGVLDANTTLAGEGIQMSDRTYAALTGVPFAGERFYVKARPGTDVRVVAQRMESAFLGNAVDATVMADSFAQSQALTRGILQLLQGFMALGLLVGIAALGVVSSRTVVERRQQVGMLRAIGFQPNMVALSFLLEASFIALSGLTIGAVAGAIVGQNMVGLFFEALAGGRTFVTPWAQIGLLVTLAYGFALLTTFIPAYQASRIYPAEALRYE